MQALQRLAMSRKRRGSTPTPQQILGSKLVAYIDAEDNTKITNVGGAVSACADVINGASYSQGTAGFRPIITTNAITGRQVFRFDGVDDYLEFIGIPAGVPVGANPGEIIFIGAQLAPYATDSASRVMVAYGGATAALTRQVRRAATATRSYVDPVLGDGTSSSGTTSAAPGDFYGNQFVRGIFGAAGFTSALNFYVGTTTARVPATTSTRTRIGANTANTVAGFYLGDLSAVLFTNDLVTAAELAGLYTMAAPRMFR